MATPTARTATTTDDALAAPLGFVTHEVANQPPPLEGLQPLRDRPRARRGARARGRRLGRERRDALGARARRRAARAGAARRTRTRRCCARTTASATASTRSSSTRPGTTLMRTAVEHGLHALPWREPRAGAHVARAALFFMMTQVEAGHGCPISMTYSAVPALRAQPELAAEWEPRLTSTRLRPAHASRRARRPARSAAWR